MGYNVTWVTRIEGAATCRAIEGCKTAFKEVSKIAFKGVFRTAFKEVFRLHFTARKPLRTRKRTVNYFDYFRVIV
jgi:hypothetical protein